MMQYNFKNTTTKLYAMWHGKLCHYGSQYFHVVWCPLSRDKLVLTCMRYGRPHS